jgi:hypothetical protein
MNEHDVNLAMCGETPRHQIRFPGFITDDEIGLGELVKRVTYFTGIKPCDSCEKRAAALNRWMSIGTSRR